MKTATQINGEFCKKLLKLIAVALCTLALVPSAKAAASADNQVFFDFEDQTAAPTVKDVSATPDNGVFTSTRGNDPTFTTVEQRFGLGAADFTHTNTVDGNFAGQRIVVANTLDFSGDFTVSMFLKEVAPPPPEGVAILFSKGLNGDGTGSFQIYLSNQQSAGFTNVIRYVHAGPGSIDGTLQLTPGAWDHIAIVRSNSTVQIYLNGVADSSAADGPIPSLDAASYVGYAGFVDAGINGFIDDVGIFNRALSASEMSSLSSIGLDAFNAIPEPSSVVLVVMGVGGLALRRVRRHEAGRM